VRRPGVDEAITSRIAEVSRGEPRHFDAAYHDKQRLGLAAAFDFVLACMACDDATSRPIPLDIIGHARQAARVGVDRHTIFRVYSSASQLLADAFLLAADECSLPPSSGALRWAQWTQSTVLDRIHVAVNSEYLREVFRLQRSPQRRQVDLVRALLSGERNDDAGDLSYPLGGWHLAAIAVGELAARHTRDLALASGCRRLFIACEPNTIWIWFGVSHREGFASIERALTSADWPPGTTLALGGPAKGIDGFRQAHSQAQDAYLVCLRSRQSVTRYSDVAILVPWLRDVSAGRWLVETFLGPLEGFSCPSVTLRQTLRAFFRASRNLTKAAGSLNVSRTTMRTRMGMIEQGLGDLLHGQNAEVELALRLDELLTNDRRPSVDIRPDRSAMVAAS